MVRVRTGKEVECPTCGKFKYYPACHLKPIKFCSKVCAMKSKTLSAHKNWKGGQVVQAGYIKVKQLDGTYLFEHRMVIEDSMGRPLLDSEKVHHIDGNKQNNHLSNLKVVTQSEHMKLHNPFRQRDSFGRYLGEHLET